MAELRHPFKYRDDSERILRNVVVVPDTDCWEWQLRRTPQGYGRVVAKPRSEGIKNRVVAAHRLSYAAFVGPIPDGLVLDHLCRNPPCCNPEHLEPVTPVENTMRSPIHFVVQNAAKTHCKHGHPFDEANTYIHPSSGRRACRTCTARSQRRRQEALKVKESLR